MDSVFQEWTKSMSALHSSIGQELSEIHRCKAEVQRLRDEMINAAQQGKYIRDDKRIVLSAPEIVIGNVGKDGTLMDGASTVIVRGTSVGMEATGGSVTTRAPKILQIAEDPGIDGLEHVVLGESQIVSMARNVVLHASDNEGSFFETPKALGRGIQIHSDSDLSVDASVPNTVRKETLKASKTRLMAAKAEQQKKMNELEVSTKTIMKDIDECFEKSQKLQMCDAPTLRSNASELTHLHEKFMSLSMSLAETSTAYIRQMSLLAETTRQLSDIDKAQTANDNAASSYKVGSTGANLSITAQDISLATVDGDGTLREDGNAGISLKAKRVSVNAVKGEGELMTDSTFLVNTQNILLDTRSSKLDAKGENGDIATVGSFSVMAKDISLTAVDSELKNKELKEKALIKDGSITLRAEKLHADTVDTEGKAAGSIELNTKALEMKAVDLDKDSRKDKEMAQGSSILVFAEKMLIGSRDKDKNKAKQLQIAGQKVDMFAKETLEVNQGDGKALLQLDGGNIKTSATANEIYGKTTLEAETEVKAELKAPKATINNLEASASFKSQNISDGIATPAAPNSASLSPKLTEEELKVAQ